MNRLLFSLLLLVAVQPLTAQNQGAYFKVPLSANNDMPAWAIEMYSNDPDVFRVDSLYHLYYLGNTFKKTVHTQNYKHWRRKIAPYLQSDGKIRRLSPIDEERMLQDRFQVWQASQAGQQGQRSFNGWDCIGPFETYNAVSNSTRSTQVNVYCMAQAATNTNILFVGTEAAGIFKSTDKGLNWIPVTQSVAVNSISGIEIDPTDANIVYFSGNNRIYKTTDGGNTWNQLYIAGGDIYEFLIDPVNTQKILAVGEIGLIKSTDGGATWTSQFSATCWDIDYMPGSRDTIYLLKNNASAKIDEFFRSDDGGATWTLKNSGYYSPTVFAEASAIGGKIAVSPLAPRLVYVGLIGDSKAGDDGWIGLFRSNNAGDNWVNPSGQTGGPYNTAHPYMVGYSDGYHQGFYNFDLEVSDLNPAKIWVASIFLWTSADSGQTFTQISPHPHADHQDMDVNGGDIWIATDGGLDLSMDELASFQSRKNGISGSEYWRLGSGWNEDVLVGGRYHNGDAALFMPNYGLGQSLFLGAAEQGTGYVNPINNRLTYFSDLGSSPLLPTSLNGTVNYMPALNLYPNEGYTLRRSELVFDCRYSDVMYLGKDNQFWRSKDGGVNFTALHSFSNSNSVVMEIEQARSNPNVIYCTVFNEANSNSTKGEIYKSTDAGLSWVKLTDIPTTYRRELQLAVNPENADDVWVGNTYGNNGQKVFRSTNGGTSWQNMSSGLINGEEIRDLVYQPAPNNDVIYAATYYGVFYWDGATSQWVNMSASLPFIINTNEMQPFFRDSKLRLGTFGKAIWEADLAADVRPLAQPITQRDTIYCAKDTVRFDCYSIIDHSGSAWRWSFSPSPQYISDSTARNPIVVFGAGGSYSVSLQITDGTGLSSSKSIPNMVTVIDACRPDSIPGLSLRCIDGDDYGQTAAFNINTTVLTISAWVKPNGIQDDYTAIVMNDDNAAGFNFRGGNNTLGYHWPGGQWWWNSNMIVPSNEWSHVAMVVNGNTVTLYVNGRAASQTLSLSAVDLTSFKIGSYQGWSGRNFNGEIDEVCIWTRALSTSEIRAMRHLTKEDVVGTDPQLVAYYQFNVAQNMSVTDNAALHHLSLANGAALGLSTAPVGGGQSQQQNIGAAGNYSFANTGLDLRIGTNHPNGEVWVSKINLAPDSMPTSNFNGYNTYWVVNNYGTNANFSIDSLRLYPLGNSIANSVQNNPALSELFYRNRENGFLNQWSAPCSGLSANSTSVQFPGTACGIGASGQFWLTADQQSIPIAHSTQNEWKLFPNPVGSEEQLFIQGIEGNVRFRLFDRSGKLLQDSKLNIAAGGSFIALPTLPEGIYFYTLESSTRFSSGKLHVKS